MNAWVMNKEVKECLKLKCSSLRMKRVAEKTSIYTRKMQRIVTC